MAVTNTTEDIMALHNFSVAGLAFFPYTISNWDGRFLQMASIVAGWSKDPSTKVGAVIADDKIMVAEGFNGFPSGHSDDIGLYHNREYKYANIVHAEINALQHMKGKYLFRQKMSIYVTHPPCVECCKQILHEGIHRIVTRKPSGDMLSRWRESFVQMEYEVHAAGATLIYA